MCSYFCWPGMEGNRGDLDDIIGTSVSGGVPIAERRKVITYNWRPPSDSPSFLMSTEGHSVDDFVVSSSRSGDTLLCELGDATFFGIPGTAAGLAEINMDVGGEDGGATAVGGGDDSSSRVMKQEVLGGDKVKTRPRSIFAAGFPQVSHGVKASPMGSPREIKPSPVRAGDTAEEKASSVSCPVDKEGLRISSPRAPGIKRRKEQAKKVVCIPAPAAASSRPSGEVVPSDLWAWRKYGQKPIKGSPYPRGYYRCSSSKGCPARKHVERSQTDPSMLVITYTSEHNHPWPIQKNALAGSTRSSQPTKNSPLAVKSSPRCQRPPAPTVEEDHKEEAPSTATSTSAPTGKEEAPEMEMTTSTGLRGAHELDHGISCWDYGSMDDFFADLGELASHDTMGNDLVFRNAFLEDKPDEGRDNSTMDPSSSFDSWVANSFGEAVKRVS